MGVALSLIVGVVRNSSALVRYNSLRSYESPNNVSMTVSGVNVYFIPLDHVPMIQPGGDNLEVFLAEHPLSSTTTAIPITPITTVLLTVKLITASHLTSSWLAWQAPIRAPSAASRKSLFVRIAASAVMLPNGVCRTTRRPKRSPSQRYRCGIGQRLPVTELGPGTAPTG